MILEDLKKQLAEEENDHQQTRRNLLEYAAIAELIKEKWDASVVKLERRLETATKDAELRCGIKRAAGTGWKCHSQTLFGTSKGNF
jgi:hypothetical protein